MAFRDDREAQRARIEALEADLAQARDQIEQAGRERDAAIAERDEAQRADPDEVLEAAVDVRSRELAHERRAQEERERAQLARTVGTRERLMVAWNLRRVAHTLLLVFAGIGALGVGPFAVAFDAQKAIIPGERVAMQGAFFASSVAAVVCSTLLVRSLWSISRFRETLPFTLDPVGWAKLVDQKFFCFGESWWHVVVRVEGGSKTEAAEALALLCARANKTFYSADDPTSDQRLRWQVDGRQARGSANRSTAYALVQWCRRDLGPMVRNKVVISRVNLTVSDEHISVSRPSD